MLGLHDLRGLFNLNDSMILRYPNRAPMKLLKGKHVLAGGTSWEVTHLQPPPALPSQLNFHFKEQRFNLTELCINIETRNLGSGLIVVSVLDSGAFLVRPE